MECAQAEGAFVGAIVPAERKEMPLADTVDRDGARAILKLDAVHGNRAVASGIGDADACVELGRQRLQVHRIGSHAVDGV